MRMGYGSELREANPDVIDHPGPGSYQSSSEFQIR